MRISDWSSDVCSSDLISIITAICREIFLQTPVLHEEAALALGATRWEMIKMAVFPFGRSGIISAAMLGLGRALGERSEEHTSELQSLMRISYAVFCLKKKNTPQQNICNTYTTYDSYTHY